MKSRRLAILVTALMTTGASAQAPATPRFEVASVKVNTSDPPMQALPTLQQGGRVFAVNLPLRELIRAAFGLQVNQLVLTSPLAEVRFDLDARAGAGTTREQAAAMLRTLLTERFALKTHDEQRELPVYRLERVTAARTDPQMKPAGTECAPIAFPFGPGGPPPPPPPPPALAGTSLMPSQGQAGCPSMFFPGGWSLRSMSLQAFAIALERIVQRVVIDATGLTGLFDIDLTYVPEISELPFPAAAANIGVAVGGPVDGPVGAAPAAQRTGPSVFTALRDQLGLRLENSRAPVNVLVVDHVQQPTEN